MSTPNQRGRATARKRSGGVGRPPHGGRLLEVSHNAGDLVQLGR